MSILHHDQAGLIRSISVKLTAESMVILDESQNPGLYRLLIRQLRACCNLQLIREKQSARTALRGHPLSILFY